ncbi:MAG: hypothetical protein ACOYEG_08830 [Petrimonas sp.]|jgi:hypothetical protein|nr:MAG: hypothetical protein BWZ00_00519 [Bacteroidetes bacterium ADurb.BinA174]
MKKLSLSIVFTLAVLFTVKAQSYALQLTNSDLDCYLEMFSDGKYLIKISCKNAPELMVSQVLSFGEYKVEDNGDYKLTDSTNEYNITLQPLWGNKVFMVSNGFNWMQMNYFVKNSEKPSSPISILNDFLSREELLNYREKMRNDKNTYKNNFKKGFYQSDFNPNFTFNANENGTYSIMFYSLELSGGTWEKENNFLKLKDSSLTSDFFVMVDADGKLKSVLMPGDFFLSNFTKVR